MFRLTMILLSLLLAAAAAGRYKAETAVREKRSQIERLTQAKDAELSAIQVLRAEMAYLESPERLAHVAGIATELQPLTGAQLVTADEFLLALGADELAVETEQPAKAPAAATLAMADAR